MLPADLSTNNSLWAYCWFLQIDVGACLFSRPQAREIALLFHPARFCRELYNIPAPATERNRQSATFHMRYMHDEFIVSSHGILFALVRLPWGIALSYLTPIVLICHVGIAAGHDWVIGSGPSFCLRPTTDLKSAFRGIYMRVYIPLLSGFGYEPPVSPELPTIQLAS